MDDNALLGESGGPADDRANDRGGDQVQADRAEVVRVLGELASRPLHERLSDRMRRGVGKIDRRPRRPMLRQLTSTVAAVSPALQLPTASATVTAVRQP